MSDDGSEDSPPRPVRRKIKNVRILSSASESESDESVIASSTRRKRMRVLSDDGASSSSSGSDVVARRKRALPALRDSDAESDSSGWATDRSSPATASTAQPKKASGFSSDSSEGNSDKCSICLLRFKEQEVGTPETCEHLFCLDCITEWSKNVNTCPVDRMTFNKIVVRACAGGRVLRTEPVKVVERRPSVDVMVVEDPTPCEICGSTDNEESMLLCDGCDLGFHMQCLDPPLTEVPPDQWLCPNCDDLLDVIHISELDDLFSGIADLELPVGPRAVDLRVPRNVRRSARNNTAADQPSTSSGRRASASEGPSTSRGPRTSRTSRSGSSRATTRRRTTGTHRRRYKRRRTRTVIIEYELEENGKFPVTKTVKRKLKKKSRRRPRTAARRSLVRASVRAKLADMRRDYRQELAQTSGASHGVAALSVSRQRAGIPALSLFGDPHALDYFEEGGDEDLPPASEGAPAPLGLAARAHRPTTALAASYRQARRKMSIPSPTHASPAPDILSSILESQALLHSRRSVVTVSSDGQLDIRPRGTRKGPASDGSLPKKDSGEKKDDRVDVSKSGAESSRKAPAYGGGGGGGGGRGWGGGYRGGRVPPAAPTAHHYSPAHNNPHHPAHPHYAHAGPPRNPQESFGMEYGRRPPFAGPEPEWERRRENGRERDRERAFPPRPDRVDRPHPARHSFGGQPWRQYNAGGGGRHSLGADNPLDMRTAPGPSDPPRHNFGPLPAPPAPPCFQFGKLPDDRSDDNEELVIDTDKYDPTEPTNDDDSGDESSAAVVTTEATPPAPAPAPDHAAGVEADSQVMSEIPEAGDIRGLLGGLDTSLVDSAVRQALEEHRGLIGPAPAPPPAPARSATASDDDSDGDCPNFSIYSATSVHIASTTGLDQPRGFDDPAPLTPHARTREDQYKEKVSKRCPITTNTRNPIKIKLNTPSLIKRVSLYDDDEGSQEAELTESKEPETDAPAPKPSEDPVIEDAAPDDVDRDEEARDKEEDQNDDMTDDGLESKEIEESTTPPEPPQISAEAKSPDGDETPEGIKTPEEAKTPEKEKTPDDLEEPATPDLDESILEAGDAGDKEDDEDDRTAVKEGESDEARAATPLENGDKTDAESDEEREDASEKELRLASAKKDTDEALEKMTESISETEDERSYTPCLDENKSKDTSLETEKEKGIEGLDTEMISEEEGNGMFSDEDKRASPPPRPADDPPDDPKKKKKKESKKDNKDKKGKKKSEISFKKLSKSGKERNYRDKDKDKDKDKEKEKNKKERRSSEERKKRKEKRKDLERYDVRTVVSEKRKRVKDAFGRDVSPPPPRDPSAPRDTSPSPAPARRRASLSPRRRSVSPRRRSSTPRRKSISPRRRSMSPRRSPRRRSISPRKRTTSPRRRSISIRRSSPGIRRRSISPRRKSISPRRKSISPRRRSASPRRRSTSRGRKRRSTSRRKRRRTASRSPKPKSKKKKRARSVERAAPRRSPHSPRRKSPKRKRAKRTPTPTPPRLLAEWSPPSVDSRLLSPRTPPPGPSPPPPAPPPRRHRRDPERHHRHAAAAPCKEVFTSGDNILVSVSFKDQERDRDAGDKRKRREAKRDKRRKRRRAAAAETDAAKPVAIIDLERSPFRELTPSPKNVIVLSDSDHGDKEGEGPPAPAAPPAPEAHEHAHAHVGPKTPPEPPAPPVKFALPAKPAPARAPNPLREDAPDEPAGPATPPDSPDAYDPFEPTRSASASPSPPPAPAAPDHAPRPASPPRAHITLEAAQKTNLSADDVIDRRPISPIEKVMALLQSTRDVSPEPPPGDSGAPPAASPPAPGAAPPPPAPAPAQPAPTAPASAPAPAPRIVLPEPRNAQPPKLFLAKPSPIKSNPVKPMQATKISRLPLPIAVASRRSADEDSPYSPGSSDFGDLFEPPGNNNSKPSKRTQDAFDNLFGDSNNKPKRRNRNSAAKVPVKLNRKKGKTQVGVKIDEDNLKILDDLPSSAVEMQVKSKFLKKLNRQERVVEEVKLVLKPHYNKKHVTKDEYKEILRRTVPKICHNKSGEINPTKIQALVEAYVKKFRKKHKLGLA